MNYYKYYLELRNRTCILFVTWLLTVLICYWYKETILFFVLNSANFFSKTVLTNYFIFTDLTEIFYVYLKLIVFVSNQMLLFSFFYHFFMFFSLGLYVLEYSRLKTSIQIWSISFLVSLFILNKIVLPLSWEFFLTFQNTNILNPIPFFFEAKLSEYLIYYINLYYLCFLNCSFSTFILIFVLKFSKNVQRIRQLKKYFYFLFVLLSTVTTPPDIISQLVISLLLIIIYEFTIFLKLVSNNLIRKPVKTY